MSDQPLVTPPATPTPSPAPTSLPTPPPLPSSGQHQVALAAAQAKAAQLQAQLDTQKKADAAAKAKAKTDAAAKKDADLAAAQKRAADLEHRLRRGKVLDAMRGAVNGGMRDPLLLPDEVVKGFEFATNDDGTPGLDLTEEGAKKAAEWAQDHRYMFDVSVGTVPTGKGSPAATDSGSPAATALSDFDQAIYQGAGVEPGSQVKREAVKSFRKFYGLNNKRPARKLEAAWHGWQSGEGF